jgi:hypothetical protein
MPYKDDIYFFIFWGTELFINAFEYTGYYKELLLLMLFKLLIDFSIMLNSK